MNNSFTGPLVLPPHPCVNLSVLILSNNNFSGSIPTNIDVIFPNLRTLKLSQNCFEGKIAPSIGKMKSLWILDPANNNLSGQIPQHLIMGCSSLAFLKLSYNNLYGKILPTITNLTNRDGPNYLSELDISHNNISGALPSWLGNLSSLQSLFCQLHHLKYLDLSENDIQGSIPSCFSPQDLEHVLLQKNRLEGPMTNAFSNSTSLVTLDITDNHLNGGIPEWFVQLCQLKNLNIMDFSLNSLSGSIPSCIDNITFKRESNSNGRNSEVELIEFGYGELYS
uniref:Uncharacterized protein n=1 Tax=Nelumbo nucifera TaxID=4432 RepID=A0A822Y849_NELNU|nr:TPA_asm: hypothetical protein HUJ06_031692 [Nelumbo nucifera]